MNRLFAAALSATVTATSVGYAMGPAEVEVRQVVDRFVAAQNTHDLAAVETLLTDSPDFLWITRGQALWGTQTALKRFATLYEGTWQLKPESVEIKVLLLGEDVAQVFVPITFTVGNAGQQAQSTRFLMNQVLVKTPSGWKVSSILPIPIPPQ